MAFRRRGLAALSRITIVLVLGVMALPCSSAADSEYHDAEAALAAAFADHGENGSEHAPGEAIVRFVPGFPPAAAESYLESIGAAVLEEDLDDSSPTYLIATPLALTVRDTVALLRQSPEVSAVSPNRIGVVAETVTGGSRIPDDLEFPRQWALDNRGRNFDGATEPPGGFEDRVGIIDADVDAPQAWRHGTDCSKEVVAVLDTGIDFSHPDLDDNKWVNPLDPTTDGNDDDMNTIVDDVHGVNMVARETLFEREESFVDDTPKNGRFDAGESIYWDVDGNRQVNVPPDQLLSGAGHGAATPALVPLDAPLMHAENEDDNDIYDDGETIYVDANRNLQVDADEQPPVQGPPQGVDTPLVDFRRRNGIVDVTDAIYYDFDGNGVVSVPPDVLLGGPAAPAGGGLAVFLGHVRHTENAPANGVFDDGESIYFDADNDGKVRAGEYRHRGPAQNPGTPLVSFVRRPNGDVRDFDGHGTAMAGIIGARGDNGRDIAGVCWRVKLAAIKVIAPRGTLLPAVGTWDEYQGVRYVRNTKPNIADRLRIINYSASGRGFDESLREQISKAGDDGILFVTSAGNQRFDDDGGPEAIYRDVNGNGMVDAGDVRETGRHHRDKSYPAGSVVAAGNGDVPAPPLVAFAADEKHTEQVADNHLYDQGEFIYRAAGNVVAKDDLRLSRVIFGDQQYGSGTTVAATDADVGMDLEQFAASEKHVDRSCDDSTGRPCTADGDCPAVGGRAGVCRVADGKLETFWDRSPCVFDLPNLVCVAGSNNHDTLAPLSSWGALSVHLAAPGVDVLTLRVGGGTTYSTGSSPAAAMVSGIAAHFWSRPGFETHTVEEVVDRLLSGRNGPKLVRHPHGVDPRFGLKGFVQRGIEHDGRARMAMGDDFGDDPHPPFPTKLFGDFEELAARHEDIGEEWLGRTADVDFLFENVVKPPRAPVPGDVSPEFDAIDDALNWPPDPDGVANLAPPVADRDRYDDGIEFLTPFFFSRPGQPRSASVRVYVATRNNGVFDDVGGRYNVGHPPSDGVHGPTDDDKIWVNGFFDWNGNGKFEDEGEHAFMLRADPGAWGGHPVSGKSVTGGVYDLTFRMPDAPMGPRPSVVRSRFRLDYGENAGQELIAPLPLMVGPSPGGRVRLWVDGLPVVGPQPNRYESRVSPEGSGLTTTLDLWNGLAQFGEVEDLRVVLLRHFECDETHRPPLNRKGVSLLDRFGASTVTVKRSKRLCAPANKNDEDPSAAADPVHLTSYTIKQTNPRFEPRRNVRVENQFGDLMVDLVKPDRLLVPTAKSLTATPAALADPIDHFKCYRLTGKFNRDGIRVVTQFGGTTLDIKRPLHLCVPVNKNDEGVIDPVSALLCYQVRGARHVPGPVYTRNQFGTDDFPLYGARELCVPSAIQ